MNTQSVMVAMVLTGVVFASADAAQPTEWRAVFQKEIAPLLSRHCVECHGGETAEKSLRLDSLKDVLAGAASGSIIAATRRESGLLRVLATDASPHMPPEGQLAEAEIRSVAEWLAMIPPDTRVGQRQRELARRHWAFRPPVRPAIPSVNRTDWVRNPIDAFILARLEDEGLEPSPDIPSLGLLRRAAFDLIGLPPSPVIVAFVEGRPEGVLDDAAWAGVFNRLLASPHYGERWGRHWLDLARYADSNGYEFDFERPYAWHYRDWVIANFNADRPYDAFVSDQIAGDELSPQSFAARVATGFCRNGPTVGNQVLEQHRWDELDDVISTTAEVFLGLTLGCARCHDHKFDPITQQDYYAMLAIFNSTEKRQHLMGTAEERATWSKLDGEIRELRKRIGKIENHPAAGSWTREQDELVQSKLAPDVRLILGDPDWTDYTVDVEFLKTGGTRQPFNYEAGVALMFRATDINSFYWLRLGISDNSEHSLAIDDNGGRTPIATNIPGRVERNRWYQLRVTVAGSSLRAWIDGRLVFEMVHHRHSKGGIGFGNWLAQTRWRNLTVTDPKGDVLLQGFPPLDKTVSPSFTSGKETADDLNARIGLLERRAAHLPFAMSIIDGGSKPRETRLFVRGDFRNPGPVVQPAVPAVLTNDPVAFPAAPPDRASTGRRRRLAEWLTSPENPLTARVMVNRIWQFHFGTGLVETASNFGLKGTTPSHPELLDWLAVEFVESGWSVKHVHRLILSSHVYRQNSKIGDGRGLAVDPRNRLLWRFPKRRLEGELIRDRILAASGTLNRQMRGPGVRPRIHPSAIATSTTRKWPTVETETAEHWRRSTYIFVRRSVLMPLLEAFDAPSTTASCDRRMTTTVPTQALQMMNDVFTNEQAELMADSISQRQGDNRERQVQAVFRRALSRGPTPDEAEDCLAFLAQQHEYHARRSDDSRAAQLALADLCQVAFNLNEFVYID